MKNLMFIFLLISSPQLQALESLPLGGEKLYEGTTEHGKQECSLNIRHEEDNVTLDYSFDLANGSSNGMPLDILPKTFKQKIRYANGSNIEFKNKRSPSSSWAFRIYMSAFGLKLIVENNKIVGAQMMTASHPTVNCKFTAGQIDFSDSPAGDL